VNAVQGTFYVFVTATPNTNALWKVQSS